jgi:hypothetical protein
MNVVLIAEGKIWGLVAVLVDEFGTTTIEGDEVHGLIRDYEQYLCWRYGQVSLGDSLNEDDREFVIGVDEFVTSRTAHDDRNNYDLFVVRRGKDGDSYGVLAIMTPRTP